MRTSLRKPAVLHQPLHGVIGAVRIRTELDLIDVEGTIIDIRYPYPRHQKKQTLVFLQLREFQARLQHSEYSGRFQSYTRPVPLLPRGKSDLLPRDAAGLKSRS